MSETIEQDEMIQRLVHLFRDAGAAHHKAYLETDGSDPEWPLWYADFLHERLAALFGPTFTRSELICLLVRADQEHKQMAPGSDWAEIYADFFISQLADPHQTV